MDRREMANVLESRMVAGYTAQQATGRVPKGRNPLKSYLVEANVPDDAKNNHRILNFLESHVETPMEIEETKDPSLLLLRLGTNKTEFFLDSLDPRFWILHTVEAADEADTAVRSWVNRSRQMDTAWLPSRQFESWLRQLGTPRLLSARFATPVTKQSTAELLDDAPSEDSLFLRVGSSGDASQRWRDFRSAEILAPEMALWSARVARRQSERDLIAVDDITANGKVTSRGNSFRLHQDVMQTLKARYAELIIGWEQRYWIGWQKRGSALLPTGSTAVLRLPNALAQDELERLIAFLFDCGEPYRLYGVPIQQGPARYVVRAIDLHSSDALDLEITAMLLRVYLRDGSCGNVLARLLTNLQHAHDARVDFE